MLNPDVEVVKARYADSPASRDTNVAMLQDLYKLAMEPIFSRIRRNHAQGLLSLEDDEEVRVFLELVSKFFPPRLRSPIVEREMKGVATYRELLASGAVSDVVSYYSTSFIRLQQEAVLYHSATKRDTPISNLEIESLFSILSFKTSPSPQEIEISEEIFDEPVNEQSPPVAESTEEDQPKACYEVPVPEGLDLGDIKSAIHYSPVPEEKSEEPTSSVSEVDAVKTVEEPVAEPVEELVPAEEVEEEDAAVEDTHGESDDLDEPQESDEESEETETGEEE